ncbi:MAG: thioredoxin family protein [Candidatus Hermodarchaeota archaeon]
MSLKWSDIKSKTISPDEYLEKYKEKTDVMNNYNSYEPKSKHLNNIKKIMKNNQIKLKILTIGAEWCHDCVEQVPNMIKIVKTLNINNIEMRILYGIKVNAFRKPGEILWDKRHSVPEAIDPNFNLEAIPTFYFFKDAELIERIVEHPTFLSSLERDLCNIVKKEF